MENPNEDLEHMIDSASLHAVVADLVAVCRAKAEHLRANWQDEASARVWDLAAARLDKAVPWLNRLGV